MSEMRKALDEIISDAAAIQRDITGNGCDRLGLGRVVCELAESVQKLAGVLASQYPKDSADGNS